MTPRIIVNGIVGEPTRTISMTREEFLIGRGSDCDLSVQDPRVSRHHCLLRLRGKEVTLSDLGAANGTFVNDVQVRSQTSLHTGDKIRVGDMNMIFILGDTISLDENSALETTVPTQRVRTGP